MKDEIKVRTLTQQAIDVLNDLKNLKPGEEYEAGMPVDIMASALLDYITNLQTIEQQYSAILSENAELENKITNLQEENERLKEYIKIANVSEWFKSNDELNNLLQGKSDE